MDSLDIPVRVGQGLRAIAVLHLGEVAATGRAGATGAITSGADVKLSVGHDSGLLARGDRALGLGHASGASAGRVPAAGAAGADELGAGAGRDRRHHVVVGAHSVAATGAAAVTSNATVAASACSSLIDLSELLSENFEADGRDLGGHCDQCY